MLKVTATYFKNKLGILGAVEMKVLSISNSSVVELKYMIISANIAIE